MLAIARAGLLQADLGFFAFLDERNELFVLVGVLAFGLVLLFGTCTIQEREYQKAMAQIVAPEGKANSIQTEQNRLVQNERQYRIFNSPASGSSGRSQ